MQHFIFLSLASGIIGMACNSKAPASSSGDTLAVRAAESTAPAKELPDQPLSAGEKGEDVLKWALDMNDSKRPNPPTEFRKGHVTPKKLPPKVTTQTSNGFAVSLPLKSRLRTPAVYGGLLYTSGGFNSKEFYAFDAKTGRVKWGLALDDDGPSTPACDQAICVINTESCTVFALDANTGEELWSHWLGDPLMSAPAIGDGTVFVSYPASGRKAGKGDVHPDASHVLAAMDLSSGKILWQKWIDGDIISAPVVSGSEVFAATFTGTLFKFSAKDGQIISARKDRVTSAPVVAGSDLVYSQRTEGDGEMVSEGIAMAKKHGMRKSRVVAKKRAKYLDKAVQSRSALEAQSTSEDSGNGFTGGAPASSKAEAAADNVGKGTVSGLQGYQGSRVLPYKGKNIAVMGDEIVATNSKTGATIWKQSIPGDLAKAGGALGAPPVIAGGHLVIAQLSGKIVLVGPNDGKVIRSFDTGHPIRSQPVVSEGWIYVGTEDGHIIAIDTKDKALTGWPQWGADAKRSGLAK